MQRDAWGPLRLWWADVWQGRAPERVFVTQSTGVAPLTRAQVESAAASRGEEKVKALAEPDPAATLEERIRSAVDARFAELERQFVDRWRRGWRP